MEEMLRTISSKFIWKPEFPGSISSFCLLLGMQFNFPVEDFP